MNLPLKHTTEYKLKGASLFYALTFTLIIAVTITSIIGLVFLHNEYVNRNKYISERIELVNKATLLASNEISAEEINVLLSTVNTTPDSLIVSEKKWGIYDLHKVEFWNRNNQMIKSDIAMMGYSSAQMEEIGAFVMDEENPLIVSGTTKLQGTSYLTSKEIKPGSIEGYGYRNKELLYGEKLIHANEQSINTNPLAHIKEIWLNGKSNTSIDQDSIVHSFSEEPLIVRADTLLLADIYIEGNVILIADNAMLLGKGVDIQNAITISPEILVDSDKAMRMQAFSNRRIEVFEGSKMKYPSALVLVELEIQSDPLEQDQIANITINENVRYTGVLSAGKRHDDKPIGKITVNENVDIKGYIFNHGPTELRCDLQGSVFTHNFEHISPRQRRYVNYLFDASINPEGISDVILHSEMADFGSQKSILAWLENS